MKGADRLAAKLAGNMMESMGSTSAGPAAVAAPPVLHGGAAKYQGAARLKDALSIKVEQIIPDPDQPRKDFDPETLADLAASLKARGQLQPIRVRYDEGLARWVIIAGERRYRAAVLAGLSTLICIEATTPQSADDLLEDQLVENCLREDLKPVEQAKAFRALMDRRHWSYRQLGATLHLSSAQITRCMALLSLPEDLQAQVDDGTIPASAAAEVAKVDDDAARREIVERIVSGELNRDETVSEVRRLGSRPGRGVKPKKATSRTFRTKFGKATIENKRGLDEATIRAVLTEILAQLDGSAKSEAA